MLKSFILKKFVLFPLVGAVVVVAAVIGFKNGNGKNQAVVVRGDIVQIVAATGKVKPNQSVNLGFDRSGRIASVYTFVGEEVKTGKILATLELEGVSADLDKARAALKEEEIKLRDIKNTSPITYNDAAKNLEAAIKEGFADADNAVRNKADQFFKNIPDNPQFEISITSGNFIHYFNVPNDTKIEINNLRKKIQEILINWQKRIATLNSANMVSEADLAIQDLNTISAFLDKVAGAINTFSPADYAYETSVSNYKTALSVARSDVSGAVSALVTAKDKFNSAGTLGEGGQLEDVLVQESKVNQARANVSSYVSSLDKSIIKAPFDGIVTLQEAKVGGAVSAGETLISIISQDNMYIEANISEINIGKIAVGNPATVTFDAFPQEEFSGDVSYIEPGDVIIDGIVNYKIRVNLKNPDPKIKSGLTANLKVETFKKEGVLAVPLYTVTKEDDKNFVIKIIGQKPQKTSVNLGITGNDGLVEVLNGLNEGDMVEF